MMISILIQILLLQFALTDNISPDDPIDRDEMSYLVEFYKDRHQNPEISLEEKNTSEKLAVELEKLGFNVSRHIGGYGIVGLLHNGDGPLVLYRTDMDALPMPEKTELDYASKATTIYNETEVGVMHSCGHDMHMTCWLGTARYMSQHRDNWSGTLMMIGQPAEEIGQGSKMMLEDGLYERFGVPDYGLGLHCSPDIRTGQIGLTDGYTMANTESIDIVVHGIGAHGATPHKSIDPVVVGSLIVMELQTIVSRNLKPTDAAVITVGTFKSGTKHNIISDEARLQLTVRTYTEEVRQMVHRRIKEICRGIGISVGLPEEKLPEVIIPDVFTPANYNNPELVTIIESQAAKAIGKDQVVYAEPMMVGEDFARYGSTIHKVPTVLYWLGTVSDEKINNGELHGLHSPYYYPEIETTIVTAIKVNAAILQELMPTR